MDCVTGAIRADGDVFTVSGAAGDISAIRVKLSYAASGAPAGRLRCSTDGGVSFTDC
jgi:hypothetical protein